MIYWEVVGPHQWLSVIQPMKLITFYVQGDDN